MATPGVVDLPVGMATGVTAAQAQVFVPCIVSLGVTQTATTVVGTPLADSIDCSAATPGTTIFRPRRRRHHHRHGAQRHDRRGSGNDTITNGPAVSLGSDIVIGGVGNDTITGATGDDNLSGDAGNDTTTGGQGIDTLIGGDNDDTPDRQRRERLPDRRPG